MTVEAAIAGEIKTRGPITFARFMELALYHPEGGYYSSGSERTSWRGHYVTAPEIDPAYGRLWAKGFEQTWESCGRPEEFQIVEIGPGEGAFAESVLTGAESTFAAHIHYTLVEPLPGLEDRQRSRLEAFERVTWVQSLDDLDTAAGCVFANEVVDNLPVHLVERRGSALVELRVDIVGSRFRFVAGPPSSRDVARIEDRLGVRIPNGYRFEVPVTATELTEAAARRLEQGAVILVDYGASASELVRRPSGTLVSYSRSGADDLVLEDPGQKDITAHANWTVLERALAGAGAETYGPYSQRSILKALGMRDLESELKSATKSGTGAAVLRAISRRNALSVLADPGGLGSFGVLMGFKDCEIPEFARRAKAGP
jgi:SAM-dependent MidA family methyltransferase